MGSYIGKLLLSQQRPRTSSGAARFRRRASAQGLARDTDNRLHNVSCEAVQCVRERPRSRPCSRGWVRAAEASATTRTGRPFASRVGPGPGIISVPITRRDLDAWVDKLRAVFRPSRDGTVALEDLLAHQEPAPALALMLQRWAVAFFTTNMEALGSGVENIVPLFYFVFFFSFVFFHATCNRRSCCCYNSCVCAGRCGRITVRRPLLLMYGGGLVVW